MQHWSSTTQVEFEHKDSKLVGRPLPFDVKLIGYPKLKCKGCFGRAVHLLPQVWSFQSLTLALKWWKICNSSATSDVIWHQALLRNTCYTAKATFSFSCPDLCRLAHQFWVCQEYLRPICQRLTCHVTICSGSVNNWLNLSLCTGQHGKGCFAWPQRAYVKPRNFGVQKYKAIQNPYGVLRYHRLLVQICCFHWTIF